MNRKRKLIKTLFIVFLCLAVLGVGTVAGINAYVTGSVSDKILTPEDAVNIKADCIIVAVGHNEYRSMSMMQVKELFKDNIPDEEKVLIDVKSLYRMDELKASGMRFWRL